MISTILPKAAALAAMLENTPAAAAGLTAAEWSCLLAEYPQFACDAAWSALNCPVAAPEAGRLLRWPESRGGCWSRLLAKRPEFADRCTGWEDFDAYDWHWRLCEQPEFAGRCDWTLFNDDDEEVQGCLAALLHYQPQLADCLGH